MGNYLGKKNTLTLAAVVCLALSALSFSSWAWVERYYREFYAVRERNFSLPIIPEIPLKAPIRSDVYGKGTFGASRNNNRTHQGIDISAPLGAPILAAKSGRVSRAQNDSSGYGQYVEIAHPDGLFTRYAHLSRIDVLEGDWVWQSLPIGLCGRSGNADSPQIHPHVHFEIRNSVGALNPSGPGFLDPAIQLAQ